MVEGENRMIITMAIDLYGDKNNGTTVTAVRTCEQLVKLGHEVRVIAHIPSLKLGIGEFKGVKVLNCKKLSIHPFEWLIESQGFKFGNTDYKSIAKFIEGSDVVHVMFPFLLESKVRKVAKVMGIPVTGAYHLQPENITYTIHMGKVGFVNSFVYSLFKNWVYKYIRTIHTPSLTMKNEMLDHNYKGNIYAISNGVSSYMHPIECARPIEYKDKYLITMVGRLSGEKRQDLIIKAIGHSKYNDKIQLILCGQGPKKKTYLKLAKKYLKNPLQIKFVKQEQLREILNYTDLYVHASDIESEAIACIEAFACGAVPVISNSRFTATRFFSLDEHCLFEGGNYQSLQEKIEFFIENEDYKKQLSAKYIESAKTFALEEKVKELEKMFEDEIKLDKEDKENNRTYFSSKKERRKLKKIAKKISLDKPYIYKDDIYHLK